MSLRIRILADVNPPTPEFDRISSNEHVTFMPLEAIWADNRLNTKRTRAKGEVSTGYTRFKDGDILVPKVTPTFQAGRSAIVRGLVGGVGAGSTELHVLRPKPNVDPRFLRYTVMSTPFLSMGVANFQGVAGLQRVPDDFLRDFPVADIAIEEQRRIADFLDTETSRIDQLAAAQANLRRILAERRASNISELVSGANHPSHKPSGITWLETIPENWNSVKITFVARLGSGHTPSRSHPEWWIDCQIPWITTGEVSQIRDDRKETILQTRENISAIGLANSAAELCPAGTVVLCRTAASAGFSAVMGTKMATSQDFATWVCSPRLHPYYLLWCLRAMRTDLLQRLATGSTHKTIYFPDLQSLKIPLPPVEEQQKIVEQIRRANNQIDHLLDAIDHQLDLLAERRQAVITAAVTGQLDVTTARSGVR